MTKLNDVSDVHIPTATEYRKIVVKIVDEIVHEIEKQGEYAEITREAYVFGIRPPHVNISQLSNISPMALLGLYDQHMRKDNDKTND